MTARALGEYAANAICDLLFHNTAVSPPAAIYVAAMTEQGEVSEAVGYGRLALSTGAYGSGAGSDFSTQFPVSNNRDLLFPVATASWGTITGFSLYDASQGRRLSSRE